MKAYVLAAGYGTRLGALARGRAKPLLDVGGRPVLSHTLDRILALEDLTDVVVVTNAKFYEQFAAWASVPVRVLDDGTVRDAERRGAVADLALGLGVVPPGTEDFVVVAGDNLIGFDLRPFLRTFHDGGTPLLLLRRTAADEDATRYNEVTLDEHGGVARFREKPADPATGVTAIGLYFFPSSVASLVPRYLDSGGDPDAPGHFISWLVEETSVRGAFFEGAWYDVGSAEGLSAARRAFGS